MSNKQGWRRGETTIGPFEWALNVKWVIGKPIEDVPNDGGGSTVIASVVSVPKPRRKFRVLSSRISTHENEQQRCSGRLVQDDRYAPEIRR